MKLNITHYLSNYLLTKYKSGVTFEATLDGHSCTSHMYSIVSWRREGGGVSQINLKLIQQMDGNLGTLLGQTRVAHCQSCNKIGVKIYFLIILEIKQRINYKTSSKQE